METCERHYQAMVGKGIQELWLSQENVTLASLYRAGVAPYVVNMFERRATWEERFQNIPSSSVKRIEGAKVSLYNGDVNCRLMQFIC